GSEAVTAWNYQQKRIEALLDENYRLTAERDALRENIGGDNTRAAADIYFQLVEEYEIPPGGSLVGYIDDIKERLSNAENHSSELDNALCELLPGTQYMDPPDGGSVTPLEQVRRMVADYRERIAELEANKGKPVMFIDGDISGSDVEKLAAVIREFNEETETPAARMARIIRENPHPTNMCDMPAAGIGVKGE
ncbi:hypothetical protein, partial [Escherichia coli]|uniref:hypothetical protein n=1 Tax=Escherichia coli TaxID=562 RepID=UPI002024AEC8